MSYKIEDLKKGDHIKTNWCGGWYKVTGFISGDRVALVSSYGKPCSCLVGEIEKRSNSIFPYGQYSNA